MGQVPKENPKVLIIGSGKLSFHLKHFLKLHQIQFSEWSRSLGTQPDFASFDWVLLAIKDSALESFYLEHAEGLKKKKIIHFSGALSFSWSVGIHPLMTFQDQLLSHETYLKIPLMAEKILPELGWIKNPMKIISPEEKALYHAHCVLAVSAPQIIWKNMVSELSEMGLTKEMLAPYLEQMVKNFMSHDKPLTGPLARRDLETISVNMSALKDNDLKNIYRSLCHKEGIQL